MQKNAVFLHIMHSAKNPPPDMQNENMHFMHNMQKFFQKIFQKGVDIFALIL